MKKICKVLSCRKTFHINRELAEGEKGTPDTVYCPECARDFKYERMMWDREKNVSEDTNVVEIIKGDKGPNAVDFDEAGNIRGWRE